MSGWAPTGSGCARPSSAARAGAADARCLPPGTLYRAPAAGSMGVMSAAPPRNLVSVDDYLASELTSPVKHEYLGGVVYAMAGARNAHNLIAGNTFAALWNRLRNQRCRPYNSDTKIRVRLPTHVRFYYPDVSVICRPNSQ